jgi:hypothetical protein
LFFFSVEKKIITNNFLVSIFRHVEKIYLIGFPSPLISDNTQITKTTHKYGNNNHTAAAQKS